MLKVSPNPWVTFNTVRNVIAASSLIQAVRKSITAKTTVAIALNVRRSGKGVWSMTEVYRTISYHMVRAGYCVTSGSGVTMVSP
jgi:hypothetical protein